MRLFMYFSQCSINIVRGALLLALASCDLRPPNMMCVPAGELLECECIAGFEDCDNNLFNGCEINSEEDSDNCGICGKACLAPQTCINGQCDCGFSNCYCADFATDPDNCGGCGTSVNDGDPCTEDLCVNAIATHLPCPNPTCNSDKMCRLGNGSPCTTSNECASNHCVDGVCCQTECAGTCQACSAAKNVDYGDGRCGYIPYFSDPDDECLNGVCDGSGQCTDPGTTCSTALDCESGYCVDGVCCDDVCTGSCMTCNRSGTVGTCVPVPVFEDDPDGLPSCAGPTVSCNGNGECKKESGQTCAANSECLTGHCESGMCGPSTSQIGPLVWQWHADESPTGVYDPCGGCPQYPWVALSSIVPRADGSVMATGLFDHSIFGLSAGPEQCDTFVRHIDGPHPFRWSIDANGTASSVQKIDDVYSHDVWSSQTCNGYCIHSAYARGPFLWSVGGDAGYHYERWLHDYPNWWTGHVQTCDFAEFSKYALPQWSLGSADACGLQALQIAGDASGNVVVRNATSLTKHDPSGQVVLSVPDPFVGLDIPYDLDENPLVVGPQGEMYVRTDVMTGVSLTKTNATGAFQWSKSLAQAESSFGSFSYGVDDTGNVLLASNPSGSFDFGNGPSPKLGLRDLVLGKLDPSGNVLWSKRFGGPGFKALSCSMRLTGTDEMTIVLEFSGKVDLGDGVLESSPVLVKFNAQGNVVWHADLATLLPFTAQPGRNWILTGNPAGEVFVVGAVYGPSGPEGMGCDDWAWQEKPLRLVMAKYGP